MSVNAADTLFIHSVMPDAPLGLSPIHLFVPLTIASTYRALRGARTGHVSMHRNAMLRLCVGGIVIDGSVAPLPGRMLFSVLFRG